MSEEFTVDLDNCDREPIHISGAVQPHGVLFVLGPTDLKVRQVSQNAADHVGVAHGNLLGQSIERLLDDHSVVAIRAAAANPLRLTLRAEGGKEFDGILHLGEEGLLLELEPAVSDPVSFGNFYHAARGSVARLQTVTGVVDMCQRAAEEVRALTGFDRVMVYRFDRQDNGHVIAESMRDGLESYLDLHYPASDIPSQARRLYTINRLRMIVDVLYRPVPITPAVSPITGAPLDLSFSVLRSVSPIHVEYLQNMGIHASMSISLVIDGRLWGLVICHHYASKFVPYEVRAACDFLSQTLSWQISARERADQMEERTRVDDQLRRLIQTLSGSDDLQDGLLRESATFVGLVEAGGAALVHAGRIGLFGRTPDVPAIERLLVWLRSGTVGPISVENLGEHVGRAAEHAAVATGVLAVPLDREGGSYLLWFRPEVAQTVNWAGDPHKTASLQDGASRLSPRGSFALWKETVRGRSLPWQPWQVAVAVDLGHAVASVVLKRAAILERLNRELGQTSDELRAANLAKDDFLATVSHELRTPLNAMLGWLRLIRNQQVEPARQAQAIEIVERNARAQAKLVEDLLDVSRIISGKMRLDVGAVNLLDVVRSALESVRPGADAREIKLHPILDPRASIIMGDGARLQQIVWNLLTNAIKFTPKGGRVHLHLTRADSSASITVSDSGEGIDPEFLPHVFERFRQAQGGAARGHQGLGLGLAIVRHLVELHGGTVSAFSEGKGRGSVFTVHMPLSPVRTAPAETATSSATAELAECPPQLRDLTVLVVDDEPDARDLVVAELARCVGVVRAVGSAEEALALVTELRPDVILSDVGMPVVDGYTFIKRVRALPAEQGGRTPAIALTAYAGSQDRTRAFLAGFQAHLPKPIEPGELFAVLVSVSGRTYEP